MMARIPRIICIHGYTSNSQIHELQMKPIVKALPEYDFVFAGAPHTVILESQPIDPNLGLTQIWKQKVSEHSNLGHRAWWYACNNEWIDLETGDFYGLHESLQTIGKCLAEGIDQDQPIVIMGMSQGACFAGMLCALLDEKRKDHRLRRYLPKDMPIVSGVIFGGFCALEPTYSDLYKTGIEAPMLHVSGDQDKLVSCERREALIQACRFPTVLRFDGGHEVPTAKDDRAKVVQFVRVNMEKANSDPKRAGAMHFLQVFQVVFCLEVAGWLGVKYLGHGIEYVGTFLANTRYANVSPVV